MKVSTEIGSFSKYGRNEEIIKMLKDAGFPCYDFSFFQSDLADDFLSGDDYLERAKKLREYADGLGIECNQAHAPFPTYNVRADKKFNDEMFEKVIRSIRVSGVLGAKIIVVHPCNDRNAEENAAFYKRIEPVAREAGVKIALENMWNYDGKICAAACSHHTDFVNHLSLLPSDVFVACLDIGHAEMGGLDTSAEEMILSLDKSLQALHVHDNDKVWDLHKLPFSRKIDFEKVIASLKKVNYQGDITLEACYEHHEYPVALYPAVAKLFFEVATYIKNRVLED